MAKSKIYTPSVPVVMRLIQEGKITIQDAADIMQCTINTAFKVKKDFGIDVVFIGTNTDRKAAAIANEARKELLTKLSKSIKYDGQDIQEVAKTNNIPSRTLYRWVLKV